MDAIFQTDSSFALLVLRLGLAITFFAHGSQKVLGWFGGRGPTDVLNNWNEKYGIPVALGIVAILTEFLGSFALLLGFLTRPFALGLAIFMAVAIAKAHWGQGFFLARRGQGENGIEYCFALGIMALTLFIGGGGALSIDRLLSR